MKFRGILSSILVALILCVPSFFQMRSYSNTLDYNVASSLTEIIVPLALTATDALHSQDSHLVIEPLIYDEFVAGSIPAPAVVNDCLLGDTQYKIEYPGGAHKLVIELEGDQDVDLYVRRATPITNENGKTLSDFKSDSPLRTESLILPAVTPVLEQGIYFIGITNCGPGAASYKLKAQILDPPDADIVNLNLNGVEVGSIPTPEPGICRVGRTQYAGSASFDPCGSSFSWFVRIQSDQNINVYIRKDKPVAVENGLVIYDKVTEFPAKSQTISLGQDAPGTSLFYIAVENCSLDVANYIVAAGAVIGDAFPPFITSAFFEKKDLHVFGHFFTSSAIILLDGQPQPTIIKREVNQPDVLIVKKAKKRIARQQAISVTIKDSRCTSAPFIITRP
jgi:hypothetical protein